MGVIRVIAAFDVDENRGWNIFAGAVELLAGIVIVSDPNIGFATLALLVGIAFIVNGIAREQFRPREQNLSMQHSAMLRALPPLA